VLVNLILPATFLLTCDTDLEVPGTFRTQTLMLEIARESSLSSCPQATL
jgi:hypothetical protein